MLRILRSQRLKGIVDKCFAFIGLIITSPIFLSVAIILKLQKQELFFIQERVGLNQGTVKIYKFTTMRKGSEKQGLVTSFNDPRIIPLGKFLRRAKINEIPQLINILRGDMSFVGPRPLLRSEVEEYPPLMRKKIYSVRPGLTGYGSLEFSDEERLLAEVDDAEKYYFEVIQPKKAELESQYVDNFSLILDLSIVFRTVPKLLKGFLKIK